MDRIVDATDRYVMPGGIDPHTHLEAEFMGAVSVDDFYVGSRAALAGGTTMVCCNHHIVLIRCTVFCNATAILSKEA